MSERNIELVEDGAIYTSPNIQPNVPVVMCWDNTDINEEILCGYGTAHCTNVIIIQRAVQPSGVAVSELYAQTTSTREIERGHSLLGGPAPMAHSYRLRLVT